VRTIVRLLVMATLGAIAVTLGLTLWHSWRTGEPRGTVPIMGVVGKYGVTSANPVVMLSLMTVIFSAGFFASVIAFFPGVSAWLQRRKDALWPPVVEKEADPSWICPRCHEESPANFYECWKCQAQRTTEDST
jgi:hypothetical protein